MCLTTKGEVRTFCTYVKKNSTLDEMKKISKVGCIKLQANIKCFTRKYVKYISLCDTKRCCCVHGLGSY